MHKVFRPWCPLDHGSCTCARLFRAAGRVRASRDGGSLFTPHVCIVAPSYIGGGMACTGIQAIGLEKMGGVLGV